MEFGPTPGLFLSWYWLGIHRVLKLTTTTIFDYYYGWYCQCWNYYKMIHQEDKTCGKYSWECVVQCWTNTKEVEANICHKDRKTHSWRIFLRENCGQNEKTRKEKGFNIKLKRTISIYRVLWSKWGHWFWWK
jgi:hypothetical protein